MGSGWFSFSWDPGIGWVECGYMYQPVKGYSPRTSTHTQGMGSAFGWIGLVPGWDWSGRHRNGDFVSDEVRPKATFCFCLCVYMLIDTDKTVRISFSTEQQGDSVIVRCAAEADIF